MGDFTLILGENYERRSRDARGVVVNSYFYEWHAAGGGRALEVAVDAVEAFSDFFGPFPYTELDVTETPNDLGGMEYSGLVVVEDGLYPGVSTVEWLTAHEVAQHWWMVVVGNDQIDELWLDKALTQYSTMLHCEAVYGEDRANAILNTIFVQTRQGLERAGRDMPAGLPVDAFPRHLHFDIGYDKGALYVHNLRKRVGRGGRGFPGAGISARYNTAQARISTQQLSAGGWVHSSSGQPSGSESYWQPW